MRQMLFYPLEWLAGAKSSCCIGISKITTKALPFIHRIIPCGVDTDLFKGEGIKSVHPTILFVGNLSGRKQGWKIIEIFLKEVLPKVPSAQLVFVTKEKIFSHPNIKIYSSLSAFDLAGVYKSAWMVCSTSLYEGFGVPILEAYASGTPVISTPHHGAKEIIRHETDGILCKLDKMGEWIYQMIQNTCLRKQMEIAGLKRSKDFSIEAIAKTYEKVYENQLR
jgi:glycosyltransferase involved in cell wall biosynthesis